MVSLKKKMLSAVKPLRKFKPRRHKKARGKNNEPETPPETKAESPKMMLIPNEDRMPEAINELSKLDVRISNEKVEETNDPDKVETKDDTETAVTTCNVTERDTGEENIAVEEETNIVDIREKEENVENVEDETKDKEDETGPEENEVEKTVVTDVKKKVDAYEDNNENTGFSESESSRTSRTFDTDDCTINSGYPDLDKGKEDAYGKDDSYMNEFIEKNKPDPGLFCGCF